MCFDFESPYKQETFQHFHAEYMAIPSYVPSFFWIFLSLLNLEILNFNQS